MARVEGIGPRAGSTRTWGLLFEPIALPRAVTGAPAVARRPERDGGGRAASCESRAAGAELVAPVERSAEFSQVLFVSTTISISTVTTTYLNDR